MHLFPTMLLSMAALTGCAHAQAPAPKAIPDSEPDVTRQVSALLLQFSLGTLPPEQLTTKAQAALAPQSGALLRACPAPIALDLLERTTKGEDRNYLYRAPCGATPLLVEINFNKAARVDRLVLRPER
jgi:hypothetical protein